MAQNRRPWRDHLRPEESAALAAMEGDIERKDENLILLKAERKRTEEPSAALLDSIDRLRDALTLLRKKRGRLQNKATLRAGLAAQKKDNPDV